MSHMIQLFLWGAFSPRTRKHYGLKTCAPLSSPQPYSRSARLGSRPGAQQGTNGEGTWAIATQWQTTSGNKGCNPAICDHQNGWEGFRGSETSPRDKVKYRRISLTRRRKNKHKPTGRSEEHTSELQSRQYLVCRLLLEKKKKKTSYTTYT